MPGYMNLENQMNEYLVPVTPLTKYEIERLVIFVRLELYNRCMACGPEAVRQRLVQAYHVKQVSSPRTIARILARNGLTHGRTGWYEGDEI